MKKNDKLAYLNRVAEESAMLRQSVIEQLGPRIIDMANLMSGVIGAGGKIMAAGNGGTATAASRFVSELVVRLQADRNRQALPAIALCVDPAVMTAAASEFGYESVFSRQIEGLGKKGDLLFILSANGKSSSLEKAVQTAREIGMLSCGMVGGDGGNLAPMLENALVIPHPSSLRVQEEQIFIIHLLVEMIESHLFA